MNAEKSFHTQMDENVTNVISSQKDGQYKYPKTN